MFQQLNNDWAATLQAEFEQPYFKKLEAFLTEQYQTKTVYPKQENVFNALNYTSYEGTRVVILGQDPYHGEGQAHGLSFSVQPGVAVPRSLGNIYKELHADLGCPIPTHGSLRVWAEQGVLLLNTVLTVEAAAANSHKKKGWENFTDRIITALNERERPVVFILWGNPAQKKLELIDTDKHKIITSVHPSPLSARGGFFGSKPFSQANAYLKELGEREIDWSIPAL
ncbi:Uracil-DNA glycosylase [Paenibacillus algorifonticola]|uniref:Uracil-DNA glycosylase n=1 Tax=Paenibacillus algorifonticola TaxID=684063 RepID=A0A1I1XZX6_9BACL|nr:uracil-DNA glycosylase [Paenibacillus algorifonticola]SFE12692.1 Uracil-DNA glycosylase [Paenibacillus algorifonticola]